MSLIVKLYMKALKLNFRNHVSFCLSDFVFDYIVCTNENIIYRILACRLKRISKLKWMPITGEHFKEQTLKPPTRKDMKATKTKQIDCIISFEIVSSFNHATYCYFDCCIVIVTTNFLLFPFARIIALILQLKAIANPTFFNIFWWSHGCRYSRCKIIGTNKSTL